VEAQPGLGSVSFNTGSDGVVDWVETAFVTVVVGALLVLGVGPTPVIMFTVTGTTVRLLSACCLFFKN
jgi:hypothetical protein